MLPVHSAPSAVLSRPFRISLLTVLMALLALGLSACGGAAADEGEGAPDAGVVNVYSSRHYDVDDELFAAFTARTGIEVNLIEANADELLERIDSEGDLSPADVFITVDAARIKRAEDRGVLAPFESSVVESRVPEEFRHPEGLWTALTLRCRVLAVSNERVPEGAVTTYEELAGPKWAGRVISRSSGNVYTQSLVAALIATLGAEATQGWCDGIVNNFARSPEGGDTDQIRAVAGGAADVAIVNHYYYARLLGAGEDERAVTDAVRLVFPNQEGEGASGRGVHTNMCAAGVVATAPNRENAIRFIEFLLSDEAQSAFASANYEYPVVPTVDANEILKSFGSFKKDTLNVSALGDNNGEAVRTLDRAGWR